MITFLEGTLVEKSPARLVLNIGGVGYEVFIPLRSFEKLPSLDQTCRVLIYDYLREDQHVLYGFMTEEERQMFTLLLGISGIGPRLAMSALSGLSVRELIAAISHSDVKRLSMITGIGKKTAERMVVELRDKLAGSQALEASAGMPAGLAEDQRIKDAVRALIALGYKQAESQQKIISILPRLPADAPVEEIVRRSLLH
ncbi:MAG: Holliday junction branch migration protein RuvA [Lentisphaerae bacterium]|nr:Holliday junction branch migration protein RuvA [Lentisphaerota bacterium]